MNVRKLLSLLLSLSMALALLLSLSMALALLPAGAVTARAKVSIPVTCAVAQGKGSVETNESSVSPGGTFTMTIIPESGYKLENIFLQECVSDNDDGTMNNTSLTESNIQVEQSTPNSNQYTFTIPENYTSVHSREIFIYVLSPIL